MQAWGATRAFEKKLMALCEGIGTVGAGDSAYEAVKARAQQHIKPTAATDPDAHSVFEVRCCCLLASPCYLSLHLRVVPSTVWSTDTLCCRTRAALVC